MPFNETHIDFSDSIADLEERIAELNEQLADLDEDNPARPELAHQRRELELQRKGAVWARDIAPGHDDFPMWDEAVDGVTLGAVRAGTLDSIEHEVQDRDGEGTDLLLVADGTVDAPYVDDGMSDTERAATVGQLHPFYRKWASARVDELLDPESELGNGTR